MKARTLLAGLLLLAIGVTVLVLTLGPNWLERGQNKLLPHAPYAVAPAAMALHRSLLVGDLHSDSLLWQRDLLQRSTRGHVDFPRLQAGNVALQVFTVVSKVPRGQNYLANAGSNFDLITAVGLVEAWPPRTWSSLYQRALYQAQKLDDFAARSNGSVLRIVKRADIAALRQRRGAGEQVTGALLGSEGSQVLEGKLDNVDQLFAAGFRLMSLQHFFDNELGGSLHGESKAGLTEFGKAVVKRINDLNIVLDVSHSSEASVRDALNVSTRPMVVSHTGLKGHCDSPRNISDELMQEIAARGGLVGIGYWDGAVCGTAPKDVVAAMRYGIDMLGAEHIALGSDYDGTIEAAFDTSELAVLTQTMLEQGFTEQEIRLVMGENLLNFLTAQLPQ